jgi:hypothetical protein
MEVYAELFLMITVLNILTQIKKLKGGKRNGDEIYISDGMVSIMLRIAQHYFNFHKSNKLVDDNFFDVFAEILNEYSIDNLKEFSAQTSSDKDKAAVESNLLIDLIDRYDSKFYKRESSKLVDDVQKLVESSVDKSFGHLIFSIIKQKYGVNFVTSSPNFSNRIEKLKRKGAIDGRAKNENELYKLLLLKEDIIERVCLKEKFPLNLKDGTRIEINCYKEIFEDIILAKANKGLGYRGKSHFLESLQNLTDYRNSTQHNLGKDLYNKTQRKLVSSSFDVMRKLVDFAFEKLD